MNNMLAIHLDSLEFIHKHIPKHFKNDLIHKWNLGWRYYHNINHLHSIVSAIKNNVDDENEQKILLIIALYHDIIYDSLKSSNEEQSAEFFKENYEQENSNTKLGHKNILDPYKEIYEAIIDTKNIIPKTKYGKLFQPFDLSIFEKSYQELIQFEKNILKEYQHYDFKLYKKKRLEILNNYLEYSHKNLSYKTHEGIEFCISFLKDWQPKIGLYIGSFKPFHIGHLNVLKKAEQHFDKIIICKAKDDGKKDSDIFEEYSLEKVLPYHEIKTFNGLTSTFIKEQIKPTYKDVSIIRGIRGSFDIQQEDIFRKTLTKDLGVKEPFVYFHCDPEYEHISGTLVRNILSIEPKLANKYIEKYINSIDYISGEV